MKTSYSERDEGYGAAMLTLRTTLGLTRGELANRLCVSRQAVGEWEAGRSYPKAEHLKALIVLAVKSHAFTDGQEIEEIRTLWKAARQKLLLDEHWLSALLDQRRAPHLHIVPSNRGDNVLRLSEDKQLQFGVTPTVPRPRVDWGDALEVSIFYGREEEISHLTQWVIQEHCHVVSVLGMGGIGKSALAVSSMYRLAVGTAACRCPFEVVIFRSLRDAPSCEMLLDDCLRVLSPRPLRTVPANLEERLSLLLEHLRQTRTLIVLDNLEGLLSEGDIKGHLRPGFEGYEQLLRQVAERGHQSCLLLTSREKPTELRLLESRYSSSVRSLRLAGLDITACKQLLEDKEVVGSEQEQEQFIEVY